MPFSKTLHLHCLVLVNQGSRPKMTEKLLTGTLSFKGNTRTMELSHSCEYAGTEKTTPYILYKATHQAVRPHIPLRVYFCLIFDSLSRRFFLSVKHRTDYSHDFRETIDSGSFRPVNISAHYTISPFPFTRLTPVQCLLRKISTKLEKKNGIS